LFLLVLPDSLVSQRGHLVTSQSVSQSEHNRSPSGHWKMCPGGCSKRRQMQHWNSVSSPGELDTLSRVSVRVSTSGLTRPRSNILGVDTLCRSSSNLPMSSRSLSISFPKFSLSLFSSFFCAFFNSSNCLLWSLSKLSSCCRCCSLVSLSCCRRAVRSRLTCSFSSFSNVSSLLRRTSFSVSELSLPEKNSPLARILEQLFLSSSETFAEAKTLIAYHSITKYIRCKKGK